MTSPRLVDGHPFHFLETAFAYRLVAGKDPAPLLDGGALQYNPYSAKAFSGKGQMPMTQTQLDQWNRSSYDVGSRPEAPGR